MPVFYKVQFIKVFLLNQNYAMQGDDEAMAIDQ